VPVPLYQSKAEFFRTLGHPVRIQVLERLGDGPRAVRELLAEVDVEAPGMSQQLAVLRRAGIVIKLPDGRYALAGPDVADLMRAARNFLTRLLAGQTELLDALRGEADAEHPHETRGGVGLSDIGSTGQPRPLSALRGRSGRAALAGPAVVGAEAPASPDRV
jgi:ArsR family transcriptional regulator, arsenate/arsenite/antimonite-responsive transcriptional repressor